MADRQKFLIVSLPRTGSTYLVDYLNAIEGVRCLSEIFHPAEIMLRHHEAIDPQLKEMSVRNTDPLGYLERIEEEMGECFWFGFKHFPRHHLPLLQLLCASRDWRKIFLWRENLLEQYLSFLLASVHFGRTGWGRVPDQVQMSVPLETLLDDIHTVQANYLEIEKALLLAHIDDVFTLEYEDLGRPAMMRGLLQFLGLPGPTIERALEETDGRAGSGELKFERGPRPAQRIQNYDEIRRRLQHSRYWKWVED